jgi:hypothetical protein
MLQLRYPAFDVRTRKEGENVMIFDGLRRKWLVLTPEEWVRQHLVHHLVHQKGFPAALISLEKQLKLNDTLRRYDVVVYDREKRPVLVVECKAPFIALDKTVLEQALRYNLTVNAPYLLITNGVSEMAFYKGTSVTNLPDWDRLLAEII